MPRAALAPLRRRDFALVWAAALVSNVGTWVQVVAVGVLVTELTGRAAWTGLVAAAGFLPIGLLSPVGGAVADRVDRRRWLMATTAGETVVAVVLAVVVATGVHTPGLVTAVVAVGGAATALGLPAFQAILPDLVEREEMLAASSLGLAQFNIGRVIGPALAGVVLTTGSYAIAFTVNAVSFGAVLIALALVRVPARVRSADETRLWGRIRQGAVAARAEPGCRLAIWMIAVVALLLSPFIALIPAVAVERFGQGEGATSLLVTAQGVGAVAGAVILADLGARLGRVRVLAATLVVLPATLVAYGLAPNLVVAAVVLVLVGGAYVGVLSGLGTVIQLRAGEEVRARVLSFYMVALGTIYPLGAVAQGLVADRVGLGQVTVATAVGFALILGWTRLRRPLLFDDMSDPAAGDPPRGVTAHRITGD